MSDSFQQMNRAKQIFPVFIPCSGHIEESPRLTVDDRKENIKHNQSQPPNETGKKRTLSLKDSKQRKQPQKPYLTGLNLQENHVRRAKGETTVT